MVVTSYVIACINVINHTNELVSFDISTNEFVAHQMTTSMNYGSTSTFQNLFSSGLNNQIEHHLFPSIISIALPYISPIVKEFAKKKGLPYHEVDDFWQALKSHHNHLRNLGNPGFQK